MKITLSICILAAAAFVACGPRTVLPDTSAFTFNQSEFETQYALNKAEWDAALAFISRPDLDTLTAGPWHQLTPNTRGRVQAVLTHDLSKFELHRNVVDVFYIVEGADQVVFSNIEDLRNNVRPYDPDRDCALYEYSENPRPVVLEKGKGVFVFPCDGHCSNVLLDAPDSIKVVVVKVPYVTPER